MAGARTGDRIIREKLKNQRKRSQYNIYSTTYGTDGTDINIYMYNIYINMNGTKVLTLGAGR